jgi:4'-phosphopantetheinyl transferase
MPHSGPARSLLPLPWTGDPSLLPLSAPQLRREADAAPLLLLLCHDQALSPDRHTSLRALLSAEEVERLEAFHRPSDRDLFLLGRASLRQLLGLWLNQPARSVAIDQGPHGKPFCPGGPQFNVSHSGSLILLGLHAIRPVGVDVERQRPDLAWEPLARRVLGAEALAELLALPAREQPTAFLAAWCQLEARLKAEGLGFAGLQALHTASRQQADGPGDHWTVDVPDGYRAAAALAEVALAEVALAAPR